MRHATCLAVLLILLAGCGDAKKSSGGASASSDNPLIGSWTLVGGWREYPDSPLMCPAKSLTFTAGNWTVNYADHSTTDDISYSMSDKTEVYLNGGGLGAIGYKIMPGGHIQLDTAAACEYARQ